jgi:CDP-6-deoxy-D-xylo-4-hexulose-3-dehydrase
MKYEWPLINDNITDEDKGKLIDFLSIPNVRLTQGAKVKEFEKKWSQWLAVKHSVFVNSGASANYIMTAVVRDVKGLGEVIVPPLGWVSDVAAVVNLGLCPVFVDIDLKSLAITSENIEKAITPRTRAIVLVHALGFNGLSREILKIAEKHDLILIEDCCESHGTKFENRKVGTFGDMSNFSFYFGHHMTTIEGGMICTNDNELYELVKMYRSHGMIRDASDATKLEYSSEYPNLNPLFTFAVPGFNMRSTELNAVVGLSQLSRLDDTIEKRSENLRVWLNSLNSDHFYTDFDQSGSSNFSLPLILKETSKKKFNRICQKIEDLSIEYRKGTAGGGNQANQPYLESYDYKIMGDLSNVNHIHDYGLYIGNHCEVSELHIKSLCHDLNSAAEDTEDELNVFS